MPTSTKLIAVADDHPAFRSQLCIFMRYHGFTVLFDAHSGQDCLMKIEEQIILPDVCILDIQMPGLDGFLTTKRIKQAWPDVRVILYSMKDDDETVARARNCGADAFVGKAWESHKILNTVNSLLSK
jgi:DNA-binding NarL/FixJ family response regulator